MKKCLFIICVLLAGCVGSPAHMSMRLGRLQKIATENNDRMFGLKVGMTKDEVLMTMGQPEKTEGYPFGSVWLYRTNVTSVYGSNTADFTPVLLDMDDKMIGWGQSFYKQKAQKKKN